MTWLTAQIVADVWDRVLDETPYPWAGQNPMMCKLLGFPCPSYRERLDQPQRNYRGNVIPRIVLVRNRMLSRLKTRPRLPD